MQGFPVTIQSPRQESAVIKWVLNDTVSRQDITINNASGGSDLALEVGTVMGEQIFGTPTGTMAGGNTGNATIGSIALPALTPSTKVGTYPLTCITGGATSVWQVQDPSGRVIGRATSGVAFTSGDIDFTITAGGTNSAAGDTGSVVVPAGAGTWLPVSASAIDGSGIAAGVLYSRAFVAADTNDDGAAVIRDAIVIPDTLIWPSGASASQIAAWTAQLAAQRIFTISRV